MATIVEMYTLQLAMDGERIHVPEATTAYTPISIGTRTSDTPEQAWQEVRVHGDAALLLHREVPESLHPMEPEKLRALVDDSSRREDTRMAAMAANPGQLLQMVQPKIAMAADRRRGKGFTDQLCNYSISYDENQIALGLVLHILKHLWWQGSYQRWSTYWTTMPLP